MVTKLDCPIQALVDPPINENAALQAAIVPARRGFEQERLRVILVGTPTSVIQTIQNLHRRGFAEVGAWSQLLPTGYEDEVMSILTRTRRREGQ